MYDILKRYMSNKPVIFWSILTKEWVVFSSTGSNPLEVAFCQYLDEHSNPLKQKVK